MSEERGTLAECWVGRLVGCNTTSHLTGRAGGCQAHSVANLPSLAPGCGNKAINLNYSFSNSINANYCHVCCSEYQSVPNTGYDRCQQKPQ